MKKVLNIVFVCVAVLSSCAKTINDNTNYYYINGETYYRVPFDFFNKYEDQGKYIQTFYYYSGLEIRTLNPGYFCHKECYKKNHHPQIYLINKLYELNSLHASDPDFLSDNRKYYLIAELAFVSENGTSHVNIKGVVSPWRIAIGRPKTIIIQDYWGDQKMEIIEIIDDYIE